MLRITPSGQVLGAAVEGLDLSRPLDAAVLARVTQALGAHGVLRFRRQRLDAAMLRDFSARFGELEVNVANAFPADGLPEVMILSNIVENGRPIGLADAGQDWHTDMSYSHTVAFANVLHAVRVPRRAGRTLGATEFSSMHAAYDALPAVLKRRLEGMTVLHDFEKFWEMMRRERGSARPPLSEAQRRAKPPVSHPVFLSHPITGRKVLYANPGYAMRINELPKAESDATLAFLFEHQLRPEFRFRYEWEEGDVLVWEDIGTIHRALADYRTDEPRLMLRCQVMATRYAPSSASDHGAS
jgi:alpha-ketoglutarate-dependent taurine dioxygenase